MFEGFGVGLTVTQLGVDRGPAVPGARASRLSEVLPVEAWSDGEKAFELTRIQRFRAMLDAYEAVVVVGLAADRPDALDPQPGDRGAGVNARSPIPGTSEFFVDELAAVTNSSARMAGRLAEQSWVLIERLPAVWAALADGELDTARARVFVDVLGSTGAGVPEAVVPLVLPEAAGLSLGRLRARLLKAVLAVDEEFAEQVRAAAQAQTDVRLYPTLPGMSELATELPAPVAAACWTTIDQLAWLRKVDGDPRPIGQLRALTHADLILRPWDDSRPPVTAVLTVTAPLPSLTGGAAGLEPGEVNGRPITAAHLRELLTQLDALCPGGLQAPTGGSLQVAVTDGDGALLATTGRRELERIARHGCPEHPQASCGCAVLDRPPPVDRYLPTPAQRRFSETRDRTCRHPGCGQPVARVDLDHVVPYGDGGETDCDNLCCLCRRHHRLKTHAPGWRFVLTPRGVLRVTTPSGITRTTRPPGLRDRIEQRALPAPPPPPAPPDEPPPF
ncbi:HNH endonuclease signature motif containing protein [Blastococcus sp. CT_GayMR16]|uniref:HNH endonuclease signature motif containing protein n=1 Tax=Blastococcus sp. CT_GayMR16 TaxID=2559607 RepID=UPI001074300A|nr:HNH endonuclease signature motif containing protein [Blastococcus sp. CT_GayMR16]TFV88748.1 HNH endonuclease [Blastococcus sp. CT_GayMR16]